VTDDAQQLDHCVVANVARETANGPGGLEIRAGLKHFPPGAKVWVLPPRWANALDRVFVVGRHRGSSRYIRIAVPLPHLTAFRVRTIHSPAVLRAILRPAARDTRQPRLWSDRAEAEAAAERWNRPHLEARLDDSPHLPLVSDPPPAEFEYQGRIYHLAHFNAYRALYSSLPPPPEVTGPPGSPS
jgi:hypothetical protein